MTPPRFATAHQEVGAGAHAGESAQFVRQAHALVRDLMVPRPARYWTDFLVTVGVGYGSFAAYQQATPSSMLQVAAFIICGLAMYRAVVFTHEITHHRHRSFRAFTIAWNALCGIPLLMPTFMYGNHQGHHRSEGYGTWMDPEYLLHGQRWRLKVSVFLLLPVVYPVLLLVRFLLLTPLAFLSSRLNRFVWTHGSSLYVMNESYRREYDAGAAAGSRWVQEWACCVFAWSVTALVFLGHVSSGAIGRTYLVVLFWIAINQVRTLAAHRYHSAGALPVTYVEQLLDTNTFPHGHLLPELWAPVGLRYHALHHLLPVMPYHSMARAHHRLMAQLPPDSPYHQTVRPGLWPVLSALVSERGAPRPPGPPRPANPEGQPGAE